jgi:serine/threonine protein kinase
MATFTLKPTTRRRGTLKYMAPEKLTKEYLPSVKSDIYSLGVLMFEVMVGRHPYFWSECLALREVMNPELGFF